MFARFLAAAFALGALVGCAQTNDLGTPCLLIKRDPNVDGGTLPIKVSEIKEGANKDFISFGAAECEDLTCVRDSNFPREMDPNANAMGYCSRPCQQDTLCPAHDGADDTNAQRKLTCRPLLLDVETLALICKDDPVKCMTYFGNNTSPFFCARGSAPDAGT